MYNEETLARGKADPPGPNVVVEQDTDFEPTADGGGTSSESGDSGGEVSEVCGAEGWALSRCEGTAMWIVVATYWKHHLFLSLRVLEGSFSFDTYTSMHAATYHHNNVRTIIVVSF